MNAGGGLTLLALASAAYASWTQSTVWDDPNDDPVRTVAMTGDPSTGELFFLFETLDSYSEPHLYARRFVSGSYGTAYEIGDELNDPTSEAYIPSVTTEDGASDLWILSRFWNSTDGERNRQEIELDQSTGAITRRDEVLDGHGGDEHGTAAIVLDTVDDDLRMCGTIHQSTDELFTNRRDLASSWDTETLTGTGAGAQEHCSIAVTSAGVEVTAYANSGQVNVHFNFANGASAYTVNIDDLGGSVTQSPSVAVGPSDTVHVAVYDTTNEEILYRYCTSPSTTHCNSSSHWSSWYDVSDGHAADGQFPAIAVDDSGQVYIAYVEDDGASANRVHVATCVDGTNLDFDVDQEVDGGASYDAGEGWAGDGGWSNVAHANPLIVVDDTTLDRVAVTYIGVHDTEGQVARVSTSPIPISCP